MSINTQIMNQLLSYNFVSWEVGEQDSPKYFDKIRYYNVYTYKYIYIYIFAQFFLRTHWNIAA